MAKAKQAPKTGTKGKKPVKSSKTADKPENGTARIAQDATAKASTGEGVKGKQRSESKMGRPTIYSQKLADEFCRRIADGGSERRVCEAEDMPDRSTIARWCELHVDFSSQYARAREERGWTLAEEAVEIADTPVVGQIRTEKRDKDGPFTEIKHADMIEHRRLQVETRKWFASKLNPKRLSDKLLAEHSGPDGGPVQVASVPVDYDAVIAAAKARREAASGGAGKRS